MVEGCTSMIDFRVRLWVWRRLKISLRLHEQQNPEISFWASKNDAPQHAPASCACPLYLGR